MMLSLSPKYIKTKLKKISRPRNFFAAIRAVAKNNAIPQKMVITLANVLYTSFSAIKAVAASLEQEIP